MKNHIKNYIKIMGLAAVPFGTAQADDYEIKVTQKYTCDPNDPKSEKDGAMHFTISVSRDGSSPRVADIVWPVDKECPNPIRIPGHFTQKSVQQKEKKQSPDERFEFYPSRPGGLKDNVDYFLERKVASLMDKKHWAEFYDPKEFSDEELNRVFSGSNISVKDPYGEGDELMPLFRECHIREMLTQLHTENESSATSSYFRRIKKAIKLDPSFLKCYISFEEKYREKNRDFKYGKPKGSFYMRWHGYTCVSYCWGPIVFSLIKDPSHALSDSVYKLIIEIYGDAEDREVEGIGGLQLRPATYVWVESDVPTCCCGFFKGLYSDNEIMDAKVRSNLDEGLDAILYAPDRFNYEWQRGSFFASPVSVEDCKNRAQIFCKYQFAVHVGNDKDIRDVLLDGHYSLKHPKKGRYSPELTEVLEKSRFLEKDRKVRNLEDLRKHMKELDAVIKKASEEH